MIATYPTFKPDDMKMTVDVWTSLLNDYTYKDMMLALQAYITTEPSAFAPSVGQLIAKLQKVTMPEQLNEMEAWDMVAKALSDSTYHSQERFAELPKVVQKAVGSANQLRSWAIDSDFNMGVAQSNFIRSYRAEKDRAEELAKLPKGIQAIATQTVKAIKG